MTTSLTIDPCIKCSKGLGQVICGGCQQWLCLKHFSEHRQELNQQMDQLTHHHNQLRHQSNQKEDPEKDPLIIRINQWEEKSIEQIRQVAKAVRHKLRDSIDQTKQKVEASLHDIAKSLQENRSTENYTEIDLNRWMDQLNQLRWQSDHQSLFKLIHDQDETIREIPMIQLRTNQTKAFLHINGESQWNPAGHCVAGGRGKGDAPNQLCGPSGLDIDDDGTLFIADTNNHRVIRWKSNSKDIDIIAGSKGYGNRIGQLNEPTAVLIDRINHALLVADTRNRRVVRCPLDKSNGAEDEVIISNVYAAGLAMDDEGSLYVSDYERQEVRRYGQRNMTGLVVAGGNGQGAALDQLNRPRSIFVDQDYSLYVSERSNHRVIKWAKGAREGVIVAGGQGSGASLGHLSSPYGIFVDGAGSIYVADLGNDRVVRWAKEAKEGELIVGGSDGGSEANRFFHPTDISADQNGNLYVVDTFNQRIQRFNIKLNLLNKSIETIPVTDKAKEDEGPAKKRRRPS